MGLYRIDQLAKGEPRSLAGQFSYMVPNSEMWLVLAAHTVAAVGIAGISVRLGNDPRSLVAQATGNSQVAILDRQILLPGGTKLESDNLVDTLQALIVAFDATL